MSGVNRSDQRGDIKQHQTLAFARPNADPGDRSKDRPVPEHHQEVPGQQGC